MRPLRSAISVPTRSPHPSTKPTWLSAATTIDLSRMKVAGGLRSGRSSSTTPIPLPCIARDEEDEDDAHRLLACATKGEKRRRSRIGRARFLSLPPPLFSLPAFHPFPFSPFFLFFVRCHSSRGDRW